MPTPVFSLKSLTSLAVNAIVFPPKKGGKSIPPEILKIILPELLRELLLQLLQPWEESARPDGLR